MEGKGMDEDGVKTGNFQYEDYNNRRVFLRSYPLHWGEADKRNEETGKVTEESTGKRYTKKIILSVYHWGEEKVFTLKRFKHNVSVYVIACIPLRFKERTSLISA